MKFLFTLYKRDVPRATAVGGPGIGMYSTNKVGAAITIRRATVVMQKRLPS